MSRAPLTPGFKVLSLDAQGVQGTNDGWWGTGKVYVKLNSVDHPYIVANEFLCSRLALAIGLPVLLGEMGEGPAKELMWVTAVTDLDGEQPAPEDPEAIALREPDNVAGTFVFDVWVSNIDRNDENVVSHPRLGLWLIDHDQAMGGAKTGVAGSLEGAKDRALSWHVFQELDLEGDRLRAWGNRVRSVPRSAIERLVTEGRRRKLYGKEAVDEINNFLLHRQAHIHTLVRRSLRTAAARQGASTDSSDSEGGESS